MHMITSSWSSLCTYLQSRGNRNGLPSGGQYLMGSSEPYYETRLHVSHPNISRFAA